MTVLDMPRRGVVATDATHFTVELHHSLTAADWPYAADPRARMHIFQSREFLDVWMDTIGRARGAECCLIAVKDGERRPILYLPLAIETTFNVRLLRFMDAGVADYNAPILMSERALTRREFERVWSEVLSLLPKFDVVDLQKMSGDVSGAFNPLAYLDCAPYASSGPAIALNALRGEVDARPSVRALRKNLGRHLRALNRIGEMNFIVNPAAGQSDRIFERLLELKRRKYLRTTGRDFLAAPGVTGFYRQMTAPGRIGRISHLSALTCGGNVISAHLGFIGRSRVYYVLPAYDTEYQRFQVGHLLLQHLIDLSLEQKFSTFDLGLGDFSYKEKWATHHLALYACERPMTVAGALYLQMRRARRFAAGTGLREWLRIARHARTRLRRSGIRSP